MAGNSNSLDRCLTSLENTLKSTSTGRPKLIRYIERTSGSQQTDHMLILNFLVECLSILSVESIDEKIAKARKLACEEGSRDPPVVIIDPYLLATIRDSTDVTELEEAVRTVFNLNESATLGAVFKGFVADERANEAAMCQCAVIKKTKKSRTCEAL